VTISGIRVIFPIMLHRAQITIFMLAGILNAISVPAQQLPEEKVVVTSNAYPVPFENLSRTVTVLTREDIQNLPVHSVADVIALAASADLRSRAPFGVQADISLRGSSFSQSLVLVDGVRVNDSQTAHHNADFPVQLQDIERIEVLLGPGSSIYGADALGGIVNIITRRDPGRVRGSISGGQHGFLEGSAAAGFGKGRLNESISFTGNRSSGFEYDRDFRTVAVTSRTGVGSGTSFLVSHVNKGFGANGFYGPAPSREWTNQTFVSVERRQNLGQNNSSLIQGYYRTHGDRFLYDINSPGMFQSSHRTHSTGALVKAKLHLSDAVALTAGGELGGDWITSNTLGNHEFARTSLFGELQWTFGKTAALYSGLRFDYYSNFGTAASPSISGSWWIVPRIRLRASAGRAFRIPTFTELYYHDPNNQGTDTLKPESSWSVEIGADFVPAKSWMGSVSVFSRRERDVIDWIRASSLEKWRAANIRKLRAKGVELGLERPLGQRAGFAAHYSRISIDPGSVGFISKYLLDYARDSWSASAFFPVPFVALEYRNTLAYKRRSNGRSYWLLDGRLEHRFRKFTAGVDFTNLLDSAYQEVIGVDMPGRWFTFSIRTR
jgi:outer membrane cobalamin receptor